MIGWMIIISTQTREERDRTPPDALEAAELARWETGPGGTDWLDQLVAVGKAICPPSDGYPCRYSARAGDVLPLLAAGPPAHSGPAVIGDDYLMPANWTGNIVLYQDRIAACPPDQMLTIEAWDLS